MEGLCIAPQLPELWKGTQSANVAGADLDHRCFRILLATSLQAPGHSSDMIVLIYFGIITVIDLEHRLILHPTSLAGAVLGLIVGTFIHSQEVWTSAGSRANPCSGDCSDLV